MYLGAIGRKFDGKQTESAGSWPVKRGGGRHRSDIEGKLPENCCSNMLEEVSASFIGSETSPRISKVLMANDTSKVPQC